MRNITNSMKAFADVRYKEECYEKEPFSEAYMQGAREFAEWLFKSKYREINMDGFSWYDDKGIDRLESLDKVLSEWQKGKEE